LCYFLGIYHHWLALVGKCQFYKHIFPSFSRGQDDPPRLIIG